MKFKVGDRVKCIEVVDDNKKVLNATGTITEIRKGILSDGICVEFDKKVANDGTNYTWKGKAGHKWICSAEELELANDSKNTIVIYQKGNEVIALDKRTGKKGVARCCPSDTFDFDTGAKLAFERLTRNFRVLCIKSENASNPYFTKGKVYEFVDGMTMWDTGKRSCIYYSYEEFINNNTAWKHNFVELKDGDDPAEILKKYDNFKLGDKVKIINNGQTYTTYNKWIEEHVENPDRRYKWDVGKTPDEGSVGTIISVGPHLTYGNELALVEIDERYYIIGVEGLEKC